MRVLVLLPDRNSPPKNDYTGAFNPAAKGIEKAFEGQVEVVRVPVPVVGSDLIVRGKQRAFEAAGDIALSAIRRGPWDRVVFLCHGWATGLQLGFRSAKEAGGDAHRFRKFCLALRGTGALVLYACSAGDAPGSSRASSGDGKGSFAEEVVLDSGVPVLAHWTAGHTTRNPDLIYFGVSEPSGVEVFKRGTREYKHMRDALSSKLDPKLQGYKNVAWLQAIQEADNLAGLRSMYTAPFEDK